MSYLLDTNIVSETIRKKPNRSVITWLDQIPGEALFISVLTLGEIRKGIETLNDKRRREKLRLWRSRDHGIQVVIGWDGNDDAHGFHLACA